MTEVAPPPHEHQGTARLSALLYVGPAVLYLGYVFVAGTAKTNGPPSGFSDKAAHFIAFGMMVPVLYRALVYFLPAASRLRLLLVAAALSVGAGGLLEVWQSFLPYRSAEFLDWVADAAGAGATVVFLLLAHRFACLVGIVEVKRSGRGSRALSPEAPAASEPGE